MWFENNNYLFYRDDYGGFINGIILRVRTYCIDEIALASNALTNHSLGLAAGRHHHIKVVMCYNCKNLFKNVFILWNTVLLISISKKLLFNPFFFVKLDNINLYKLLKYHWNRMWLSLFIYSIVEDWIFTPIWWCFYYSSYSSSRTNPITSPCYRVLLLLLLKRSS